MDPLDLGLALLLFCLCNAVEVREPDDQFQLLPEILGGVIEPLGEFVRAQAVGSRVFTDGHDLILERGVHAQLAAAARGSDDAVEFILAVLADESADGARQQSQSGVLWSLPLQSLPFQSLGRRLDRRHHLLRHPCRHHVVLDPGVYLRDAALRPRVANFLVAPPFRILEPPVQLHAQVRLEHRPAVAAVWTRAGTHGPGEHGRECGDVAGVQVVLFAVGVHARVEVERRSKPVDNKARRHHSF